MSIFSSALRALRFRKHPIVEARRLGVRVGDHSRFIAVSSTTFGSEPYLITIGDHVTITEGVRFVTHDGGVWVLRNEQPNLDIVAPISVGNNVFIGMGALLLPGVNVGSNVVIAAGSVVSRDIPDDCVAAGIPARPIKTFEEYRLSSLDRGMATKGMSREAKRSYLVKHFEI